MVESAAELVRRANASVTTLSVEEAKALLGDDDVVVADVREVPEVARGRIPGGVHVARGSLEFFADPNSPAHKPELSSGKRLVVYCASGARSALAAKTLQDMGIPHASNLLGGFNAWKAEGGEVEA